MNNQPIKPKDASPYLNLRDVPVEIRDLPLDLAKRIAEAKKKREPKVFKAKLP